MNKEIDWVHKDSMTIKTISNKEQLYDSCENIEQLYDRYYIPTKELNRKLISENQQLKQQLEHCYCNRTDCSARIKDSKKYNSLQQDYDNLKQQLEELSIKLEDKAYEQLKTQLDVYKQQLEEEKNIRNKAIEKIKMLSGFNRTGEYNSFKMYSADFKELVQILQNKE